MNYAAIPKQLLVKASAHYLKIAREDRKKAQAEKRLWSIAAEVEVKPGVWKPEIVEVMASDKGAALASYFVSQPKRVNIVGVAPTLGFWVNEKDGTVSTT